MLVLTFRISWRWCKCAKPRKAEPRHHSSFVLFPSSASRASMFVSNISYESEGIFSCIVVLYIVYFEKTIVLCIANVLKSWCSFILITVKYERTVKNVGPFKTPHDSLHLMVLRIVKWTWNDNRRAFHCTDVLLMIFHVPFTANSTWNK